MSSTESVSKMVDSLMQDWARIVHLYCLIEDMAEYLRLGIYIKRTSGQLTQAKNFRGIRQGNPRLLNLFNCFLKEVERVKLEKQGYKN